MFHSLIQYRRANNGLQPTRSASLCLRLNPTIGRRATVKVIPGKGDLMSNISTDSAPVLGSREKSRLVPHRITLVVMWVVTTAAIVVMLFYNVRSTGQHKEVRYVLQVGYVAALLWYLGRSGPSVNQLSHDGFFISNVRCWRVAVRADSARWDTTPYRAVWEGCEKCAMGQLIVRAIRLVQRRWWFSRLRRHLGHQVVATSLASLVFGDSRRNLV